MFQRRRGSVLAYAISLTALFLTMIVGTMSYFEASNKKAASEKWREVAEQAARSGLDLAIGWGEINIDRETKLPKVWDSLADRQTLDPVFQYLNTVGSAPALVRTSTAGVAADANPEGLILGARTGEYVLGMMGNYVVTFKARVQQFKMAEDLPRQYRIGVVGRIRKVTKAGDPGVDNDEKFGVVAERVLVATIGKEPFSRYAALIDIDAVKNWVPGEEVQGPVHINRGYAEALTGSQSLTPLSAGNPTASGAMRSFMRIHSAGGPGGFQTVTGKTYPDYPAFLDTVSMTVTNDGADPKADDDTTDAKSFIEVDGAFPRAKTGMLGNVFRASENRAAMYGMPGPVIVDKPIDLPANSRRRLGVAVGLPPTRPLTDFLDGSTKMLDTLEDGVYVPTANIMSMGVPSLASWQYNGAADDYPAGGIYIKGNVEVMRMSVSGQYSYYVFQLGYGLNYRRSYIIRADRVNRTLELRSFPRGGAGTEFGINTAIAGVAGNLNQFFPGGSVPPTSTDIQASNYAINGPNNNGYCMLPAVPAGVRNFPFNGIVFVDYSKYDAGNRTTGNIYCLGDPGRSATQPYVKTAIFGDTKERVATNDLADPTAAGGASRLTIITAGNMFIQNHIILESLRYCWSNPIGDNIRLSATRDLIGLVADKQVVIGLAAAEAPVSGTATRQRVGCVVHAAIAALGDPNTAATSGVPAYWGSVATEGLQQVFGATYTENYRVSAAANYPPTPATLWAGNPGQNTMGSTPFMSVFGGANNIATTNGNPNVLNRGRLLVFGSVTQRKRGALGAGNNSFDKDIRYDKRLASIAPPMFPNSTAISMRVSTVKGPGDLPYLGGTTNGISPTDHDFNFMAVNSQAIAVPAP